MEEKNNKTKSFTLPDIFVMIGCSIFTPTIILLSFLGPGKDFRLPVAIALGLFISTMVFMFKSYKKEDL